MKKFGLAAAAAIAFATISTSAAAVDGQFFVDGGIGRASHDFWEAQNYNDKTDWATSIRAGYLWHSFVDYGVELGYADLGQAVDRYDFVHNFGGARIRDSTAANGWLFGGRVEYTMSRSWSLLARGGWFRPRVTQESASWYGEDEPPFFHPVSGYSHDQNSFNTGTHVYYGLGVGYSISAQWRVGLNYDHYDLGSVYTYYSSHNVPSSYVKTYSASVQYRF
jgi:opacity protein-like surface antigen